MLDGKQPKKRKWLHESHVESIKIIKLMMWTNRKYFSCLSLVPILFFPSAISFFVCYCSDVDIFLFSLFAFFMLFCSGCFNIILIMQSFQFSGINWGSFECIKVGSSQITSRKQVFLDFRQKTVISCKDLLNFAPRKNAPLYPPLLHSCLHPCLPPLSQIF